MKLKLLILGALLAFLNFSNPQTLSAQTSQDVKLGDGGQVLLVETTNTPVTSEQVNAQIAAVDGEMAKLNEQLAQLMQQQKQLTALRQMWTALLPKVQAAEKQAVEKLKMKN